MSTLNYPELRVLMEDLVKAWPAGSEHTALEAARTYLRWHCCECGARLSAEQVGLGRDRCATCVARLFW